MRKRLIGADPPEAPAGAPIWLDLDLLAQAEITSEDAGHPIEAALIPDTGPGWRAAQPGEQALRLRFDKPQTLKQIHLVFQEDEQGRTQEFVLRWSADGGQSYREIVRQQFNFSPPATAQEVEDYDVVLQGVTVLELQIVPDISGGPARASLAQLRLA
jgi:hypothetical protein